MYLYIHIYNIWIRMYQFVTKILIKLANRRCILPIFIFKIKKKK